VLAATGGAEGERDGQRGHAGEGAGMEQHSPIRTN
jgi:hypothetical protein